MPNHITNIIYADPEVISAILNEVDEVDFNLLVPAPENIETGGCSGVHQEGEICWYDWNRSNWGTKWNAYSTEYSADAENRVTFDTAWTHPEPIIDALSKRFPNNTIFVQYADENEGYNQGEYLIKNGEVIYRTVFENGSPHAELFASFIRSGKSPLARGVLEWGEYYISETGEYIELSI